MKRKRMNKLGNLLLEPTKNDTLDTGFESADTSRFRRRDQRAGTFGKRGRRQSGGCGLWRMVPGRRSATRRRMGTARRRVQRRPTAAQRRCHLPAPLPQQLSVCLDLNTHHFLTINLPIFNKQTNYIQWNCNKITAINIHLFQR